MKNNIYKINKISLFSNDISQENDVTKNINEEINIDFYSLFLGNKKRKIEQLISDINTLKKDINNFNMTINDVYNKISSNKNGLVSLLVFGYIQSGKTDFIIGSIIKQLTNNKSKKLIIVLTSNITELSNQTFNRFKNQAIPIGLTNKALILNFQMLKKTENCEKCAVVFLCKNICHLEKINEFIDKNIFDEIIVFDDEGDQASFNDYDKEKSNYRQPINREIRNILERKSNIKVSFISITASPFAHIIADEENALKPDFAYILKPGCAYIGIDQYVNEIQTKNSSVINVLEDNYDVEYLNKLDLAFCDYLIQCLIFKINPDIFNYRKPRMLVNIFWKKSMQEEIRNYLNNSINSFVNDYLKPDFNKAFLRFKNNELLTKNNFVDWNKSYHFIKENIVPFLDILMINSDYKRENKDLNLDNIEENNYQIIVGSHKLGRGITIQDLTTTYIKRRSENNALMDAILQQARWLGYRKDYYKFSRIYMTESLLNDYLDISQSIEDLEMAITNCNVNDISFKEIERFIRTSPTNNIKPTRSTIAQIERVAYNGLFYLMNNKLKTTHNYFGCSIDSENLKFFKKFIAHKNICKINNYPAIFFNNIDDFNRYFFSDLITMSNENLIEKYKFLFSINDIYKTNEQIFKKILQIKNKEICVRYIFDLEKNPNIAIDDLDNEYYPYKERKLVNSNNFGNGNYANENEIYFTDKYITIDILPLKIWNDNEKDNNIESKIKIIRSKLFIPKSLTINKVGYKGC